MTAMHAQKGYVAFYRRLVVYLRRLVARIDRLSGYISPAPQPGSMETPEGLARRPILFGAWTFIVIFGVFGLWSALAPLNSAAIALGQVVLDSNRKTIQHLEGGIVAEIYVREGEIVKKDAPLIRLDDTAAKAQLDLYRSQSVNFRATEARLLAERDNKETITFPADLLKEQKDNPVVAENIDSQKRIFDSRRKNLEGQIAIFNQKIAQFKEEINGLKSQKDSATSQISLLRDEIKVVARLLKDGNAVKPRLLALQRQEAALEGERGDNIANMSRAQQSIAEAEISMINLKNDFLKEVVSDLKDAQAQIADLQERIRASADKVSRIIIYAPLTGTVTGLKVHTIGGVVTPGEAIMDIVPTDDKLIVEARVRPQDIDVVRPDLNAQVRLTAYRSRYVPPLMGRVIHISADRFVDERTGEAYYSARIEIDKDELAKVGLDENVKLYPGMPADVLIVTGSRSFLAYLFDPINHSFSHAFREQ